MTKECHKHGGRIAIEWPKDCECCRIKHVEQYLQDLRLNKVHINGCALGLIDTEGIPILKPWTIATDDPYLHAKFQDKLCPGREVHPVHTPVPNYVTEEYTDPNGQIDSQRMEKQCSS